MAENAPDLKYLRYKKEDDGVVITGFQGEPEALVIPETIDGAPVVRIGDGAFDQRLGLSSITLPEGLKEIGEEAFDSCASLTSIELPEGLTNIGSDAFCGCASLTSITLPPGMMEIEDWTFDGCVNLTHCPKELLVL